MRTDTLPHLLRARAAKYGERTALREKEFGIWREISWMEYADRVRRFALGLVDLGLNKGDHVCILAENEPKWLIADLAAQSVGAVAIGVYPTNPAPEAKYVIAHSESVFVVCGDQEQVDKILAVKDDLALVKKVVVMDMKGLRRYKEAILMPFAEVEKLGRERDTRDPGEFERILDQVKPDDIAVMVYTSGTTGPPKGAMILHEHVINVVNAMSAVVGQSEEDEIVSYLPLCHVAERLMSVGLPLNSGATVNFAESVDTVVMAMTEVLPTFFFAVPRIWEKMMAGIMVKMKDAGRFKKLAYGMALPIGKKAAECRLAHRPVPLSLRIAYWFAYVALLRHLKKELGLLRVKIALSGAAPISPEVLKFHHSLGIEVLELYGMTEETGVATSNLPGEAKLGTVGKPLPGVELKIAEDGEILTRCNHIFAGYWRDPEATAKTIQDGWLHTGDVGLIDSEGRLTITDRKKEIIITSGGKNIAPSEIENRLKCSPYINEAIVVGDRRNYLTALIQIEYDNVAKWAQDRGLAYTTFKSLAQHPDVFELIRGEVMDANKDFAQVETVKKFRLLDKALDHDDNELTATLKLRRKTIYEKFHDVIEDMYKSHN